MTTKRTFKNLVSFVLAIIMIFSMMTIAFAAETDIAQTSVTITGGTTFYLNAKFWDDKNATERYAAFFCNGSSGDKWYSAQGPNSDGYYYVTVNSGESHKNIIWCRMNGDNSTNNWDNKWNQTGDLVWDGSKNLFTVSQWDGQTSGWSSYSPTPTPTQPEETEEPDDPEEPADKIVISFLINSDTKWVSSDDAKMFVNDGSNTVEMKETVDTKSGHVMWTAKVAAKSSYTFYRTSYFFDESNASSKPWNKWTASSRGSNTVYKATSSTGGSWAAASTVNAADVNDINNFWDDLWIDTVGDGNPEHVVKVYYNGSTFELYVPSYVDLSNVTVYSDHEKVVIGGTEYASGTKANLTTGEHSFAFKDGSTTTSKPKLNIYQTQSTAAMLMTTKEELYTDTTAGLQSSNAWPSGSGITADNYNNVYKDAIETKGTVYFYDEKGALMNGGDGENVLKKIKGRGNSSFEASMRIYGKYAYNFNLDKKLKLADGAVKSKKWSLMANNVDHSMLRNTFAYSLAETVGIKYAPKTRIYDVYDNGKYLGAYSIAEKVEYGGSTLMEDMESLDDGNEEANTIVEINDEGEEEEIYVFDEYAELITDKDKITINGNEYEYQYSKSSDEANYPYKSPEGFEDDYNFLLEFELFSRYKAEASWFVSKRTGQAVVVKYPEFATKDEMEWIIREYEEAESAIYANNYDAINNAIDIDSFVRMYLIQELSINLDSCATSYYIHNDQETDKLVSSPVWDYDWAFGSYAGNAKYIYNGSSVVSSGNMSNPKQMFVKDKALKTDSDDNSKANNYNFQAKLVHNETVWKRCQYIWTNDFVPALMHYVDNDYITSNTGDDGKTEGVMLTEWLPAFTSAAKMNDARWGVFKFTGDDWGTKVTSDYKNRSFDFKVGNTGTSGSATKAYENTVYYLNDWIVTRWNYMSGDGGLYNKDLLEQYEITDVDFTGVQDSSDDTKLTVTPSATVTMNGEAVDAAEIIYTIYVNGEAVYNSNFTEASHTITLPSTTNEVYVVVGVKDSEQSVQSESQTFTIYVPEYSVENVTFTAVQVDSVVTVTPSATVTKDGVDLALDQIEYTVYVNDKAVVTKTFGEGDADVTIPEGQVSEIYIKVNPVGVTSKSGTSAKQTFAFGVETVKVQATLYFKSSSSARYAPKVTVGDTTVAMTKSGNAIGKNASQTQSYYWYTATVEVDQDVATKLTFTNSYSMSASTTVTLSNVATFYYGVDNLNDGSTVVDLTEADEYVRNFTKSASHMVYNDAHDAGVATTSINGKIYKMGDADGDNIVSVMDSTTIQRALVGKTELTETNSALADFDLNSVNSIMDATAVQTYLTV